MKTILLLIGLGLCGCVSASPIDFLIPSKKAPLAGDYLGHLDHTQPKWWYHNLASTKYEQRLMDLRRIELEVEYQIVKGFNNIQIEALDPISNVAWGLIMTGLAGAGIMVPRPQEKKKIEEALHKIQPKTSE